jgi:Na+/proline symporter
VLWTALTLGGILTVAFTFFFGTENLKAQAMMTGVLTIIVFLGLFVIVSIDHPFTGPVHVGSGPLQHVLEDFAAAPTAAPAQSLEPPSTRSVSPLTQRAESAARNTTAAAMSSGWAMRFSARMRSL